MTKNLLVEVTDVSFSYGCHLVLDGISLSVERGESVGVTGPNGSGKSTLLKLLLGRLKPCSGRISLFGTDIRMFKDFDRIGYVSQKATAFNQGFPITVEEVVATGRIARRGMFRPLSREDRRQVYKVLERVDLYDKRGQLISTLSGGQQQRVFIARALVSQPELLLLDEPAAGLDAASRKQFYDLLKQLVYNDGMTLIIVSHDHDEISPLISKQVCLNKKICTCDFRLRQDPLSGEACIKRLWSA